MNRGRRRFLAIAAGCTLAATGARTGSASPVVWRGRALGAEARIELFGASGRDADQAIAAALDTIQRMERLFSHYRKGSALNQLNATGALQMPPEFARLTERVAQIHRRTGGLFDPTVQPLMIAQSRSRNGLTRKERDALRARIGWDKVKRRSAYLSFSVPGMAMTLNGIAQGFATDRVNEVLLSHGFDPYLVHIGEFRAGEQGARIGIAGARGDILDHFELKNAAVATSSPSGTLFENGSGHIVRPDLEDFQPRWQSVTVKAETAAVADGLSTALALTTTQDLAESLFAAGLAQAIWLEDRNGSVVVLS